MGPEDFARRALAAGLPLVVRELAASTRTARDAAAAVGCCAGAIVKSLVVLADDRPVLVLQRGDRRVDLALLRERLGARVVRRADPDRVYAETGYAIGGVPPLGHLRPLPTLLDACIAEEAELFAAAGGPRALFATSGPALRRACRAEVACCCMREEE